MSRPLLRLCWQGWQLASFYESNLKVAESLWKLTWNVEVDFYNFVTYWVFFYIKKLICTKTWLQTKLWLGI